MCGGVWFVLHQLPYKSMASQCEREEEQEGGSQGRPEVEMNDCENQLRAKPQPAGVQIDRTDTDTGVCVPHLQLAG